MKFLRFLISRVFFKHILLALGTAVLVVVLTLLGLNMYTRHGQALPVPDLRGKTIEEVKKTTRQEDLRYEVVDSVFLMNKGRGTVVDQNPAPGFRVKENRTIFITLNAVNPKKVNMPNVMGVSFRQAKAILEASGLRVGKIRYESDIALNNVLEQNHENKTINPGTKILKYSKIDLVLGNGYSTPRTFIPSLIGNRFNLAKEKILDSYCNVGTVKFDQSVNNYSDSLNAMVWKQFPSPMEKQVKKMGTPIDLWLTLEQEKIPEIDPSLQQQYEIID